MTRDDPDEHVAQVSLRVDPVHLAGFDERGDDRPMLAAAVGAGEEMIFAPERDRPDCAFDDIGVDLDAAVVEEASKAVPARERVADCSGDGGFAGDGGKLGLERLTAIIRELQRHRFGRRAQQLDPEQLALALEDVEQTLAAADVAAENDSTARKPVTPRRRRINRGALPPHLPREEIIIDVADKTCACCGGLKHRIGEDVSETARCHAGAVQGYRDPSPHICLPGVRRRSGAGAGAGAADRERHSHRDTGRACAGRQICRSHAALSSGANLCAPRHHARSLYPGGLGRPRRFRAAAGACAAPGATEAIDQAVRRRDHGTGARSWAWARQEGPVVGLCGRRAALGRPRSARRCLRLCARPQACAAEHLAGFRGILQVDGYGAYAHLAQHGDVALAFCWSHVRRQFYEIQVKTPAPIATQALVRIAALYAIEADIRGLSAEERRQARQRRAKPLIDDLRLWLEAQLAAVSGNATIAGAIRYTLSRWDGHTRFHADGRIEIDSSVVERAIRPIALGRKNHLFAGSDGGGEHWAVIASLIETCKMNGVDPQAYLRDVLARIVARHPMGRIDQLLPFAYVSAADKAAA